MLLYIFRTFLKSKVNNRKKLEEGSSHFILASSPAIASAGPGPSCIKIFIKNSQPALQILQRPLENETFYIWIISSSNLRIGNQYTLNVIRTMVCNRNNLLIASFNLCSIKQNHWIASHTIYIKYCFALYFHNGVHCRKRPYRYNYWHYVTA